jgi:hypothetical protein
VSRDIVLFSGLLLVVLCRVEGEGAEQFAGVAVDDPDVEVGDEGQDVGRVTPVSVRCSRRWVSTTTA